MATTVESLPRPAALDAIGVVDVLTPVEAGILVATIWRTFKGLRTDADSLASLELPLRTVAHAAESLRKAGLLRIEEDGSFVPVMYLQWCDAERARLSGIADYNARRSELALARQNNLSQEMLQMFAEFWREYPKARGRVWHKATAMRAFQRALRRATFDRIMTGLKIAKRSEQWMKDWGRYIPMPSTFLNQSQWEDYIAEESSVLSPKASDRAFGKTVKICGRLYTASTPPKRDEFKSENEYRAAMEAWRAWLAMQ